MLRHVRAAFSGFSARKIIENPYGLETRQFFACVPCMVTVAREKNWARLADAKRRGVTQGPLRPYRNHPLPQQVPERFHGMHPTFASACGAPPGHPTPKMNEIRQRTHVAARPGSILGVFGPENRRNYIEPRNATIFCVRALHGHFSAWKKMGPFGGCEGETYDRGSPPPIPKPPSSTPSTWVV